jgi:hypothetical protein
VLKAREDMLGQQVCCPQCNAFFVLRAVDSVEFRQEQARLRAEAEEQAAQKWLRRAFWLAVFVGLSFIVMLVIGLLWGAGHDRISAAPAAARPRARCCTAARPP